jgi:beta-glucanase (GH16 family)
LSAFAFSVFTFTLNAQLKPAGCVHGSGYQMLLDTYLASMGACNCQRSGVILTGFPKCESGPFMLEFEDNFDGDSLNTSNWEAPDWQGALQGNQNVNVYQLKNVSVSDGICHITANEETVIAKAFTYKPDSEIVNDGLPNLRTYNFTSGLIRTKRTFFYGKYEIRCKMPDGNGFWPAFWVFGGKRWNEIDFFDNYAGTKEVVNSLGHDFEGRGTPNGCNASTKGYDLTQWHTFTCVFDYDKLILEIDGNTEREVYRVTSMDGNPIFCGDKIDYGTYYQLEAFPIEPMKIIVNMALISKNGPGKSVPIDDTTPFPSSFEIDYVRYWKRVPLEVEVYPDPTTGKFTLKSSTNIKSVEIQTPIGKTFEKFDTEGSQLELNIEDQPDGIYLVTIELENVFKTLKIIKIGL